MSDPVVTEPVEKTCEAAAQAPPTQQSRGPRGRPQGSQKRHRREVELSPSLRLIQEPIKSLLKQMGDACKVVSFLFDGELGHHDALPMVRQVGLHVVSKRRDNAALSFPYAGPYAGRGPRRKQGKKLD
jgi:putative transposase